MQLKNMHFTALCILVVFHFLNASTLAQEKPQPIKFYYLSSPDIDDNSALTGSCTGDTSSYSIECTFHQMRVRYSTDPKDLPNAIEKMKKRLRAEVQDPAKFAKAFCRDADQMKAMAQSTDKLTSFETDQLSRMLKICENPTYDEIENFMIHTLEKETKTCIVSTDTEGFTLRFQKVKPNKWICNKGPNGPCNAVTLIELEHEKDSPILWNYKQTRTYADRDEEICKSLEVGKPLVYDWQEKTIGMKCDFIRFGF